MKQIIIILIVTILILSNSGNSFGRVKKCSNEREKEMDSCAAKLTFLGDHTFKVPKGNLAMESFCSDTKNSISCLQSYSKDCLQGFTKQLFTSMMKKAKLQANGVCGNDNVRKEFLTKMACISDNKIKQFYTAMDASVARFEYVNEKVPSDNRIQALCCSYLIFVRDVDKTIDRVCGKPTGASKSTSSYEYIYKIVVGAADEFSNMMCDSYQSFEDCKKSEKTSNEYEKLEELTKKVNDGKLKPKGKSVLPILIDILDSSKNN